MKKGRQHIALAKLLIWLDSEDRPKAGLLLLWPPGAVFKPTGVLVAMKGALPQHLTWHMNRVCQLLVSRLTGLICAVSCPSWAACLCHFRRKAGCWGFSESKELQDMADISC